MNTRSEASPPVIDEGMVEKSIALIMEGTAEGDYSKIEEARAALEAGCAGLVAENARLREALKTARPLVATYGDHPDATDAMVRASLRAAKQIDNVLNGEMK
jgi:hypothetical protein